MADSCGELSAQIAALRAAIAALKIPSDNQIRQIANSVVDERLPPKIIEVENKLLGVETTANTAQSTAGKALSKASSFESTLAQMNSAIAEALKTAKVAKSTADLASGLSVQAKGEAINATTKAAVAAKDAADATNAVGGLRGLIDGIGAKVDGFGRAIASLEAKVGKAITDAARAIGISSEALSATGRLAAKIAEIFQIIGTFATLIEQLATLNVLGGRIDAVEAGLQALGNSVSDILGKLLGLQGRIKANEVSISEVRSIAIDARSIGEAANLKAGSAYVLAGQAQSTASTANTKATQAQTTADGAVRNAATANENATTAYKKAIEAEGIGQQAKRIAGDALGKAGTALTTALTAIALYQTFKGLRGLQGIPGIPGRQGDKGLQGLPGKDGITTVITLPGTPGAPGQDGRPGTNGFPGRDGRDGVDAMPYNDAGLRAFIASQHAATQSNINNTSRGLVGGVKAFFTTQLAAITTLITTIATNSYVEKALSVLTFAATVHNALMLSNNIGQTLGGVINTVLGLVLPKGLDGNPIDIFSTLGKTTEFLIKEAVGEENYTKLKTEWALANRIYQATANVANALTNATQAVIMGLEVVGSTTGKIGNALRFWGVLNEKAYEWFNPQPNFHNKLFISLENAQVAASTIEQVVQVPVSVVDAKKQYDDAQEEFKKAIKGDKNENGTAKETGIKTDENKDKKDEFDLGKSVSQGFEVIFEEIFDAGD